jgi:hypothetical protein
MALRLDSVPPSYRLRGDSALITGEKSAKRSPSGDDAWRAIETMQKYGLPVEDQAKFLGGNARRLSCPAWPIRHRLQPTVSSPVDLAKPAGMSVYLALKLSLK